MSLLRAISPRLPGTLLDLSRDTVTRSPGARAAGPGQWRRVPDVCRVRRRRNGAAYVPDDADDPDERARLVFAEAGEAGATRGSPVRNPGVEHDGWVTLTSGSTGKPRGVAVLPPLGGGARRCRGADLPAGQADRSRRQGDGRALDGRA